MDLMAHRRAQPPQLRAVLRGQDHPAAAKPEGPASPKLIAETPLKSAFNPIVACATGVARTALPPSMSQQRQTRQQQRCGTVLWWWTCMG